VPVTGLHYYSRVVQLQALDYDKDTSELEVRLRLHGATNFQTNCKGIRPILY